MKSSTLLFAWTLAWFAGAAQASTGKIYDFKVFLEDEAIGTHRFVVTPHAEQTYVNIDARFDVKFLFFTAYRYSHHNNEVWQGDCLQAIHARTDDNGDELLVRGERAAQQLVLQTPSGTQHLVGCIKTFAYWDADILNSTALLNAQTGKLEAVQIDFIADTTLEVRGKATPARHYRIHNEKFSIDLWYSLQREWLALESTTEQGARLRYQIQ